MQVRELTAWNDRPAREAAEVTALLASAAAAVERERASARDGLVALTLPVTAAAQAVAGVSRAATRRRRRPA